MPRILLADDHAILREGLKQILAEGLPEATFGESSTTQETIDQLNSADWDALVLDVFMPGRGGMEVLHEVRRAHSRLPVLVLSSAPEEQLGIRVLKAGASGYLNKQAAPERLVEAVQKLLDGGRYASASLAERMVEELARPKPATHEALSDREFQVLQLLLAGHSLKEIAAELAVSPKTISTFHTRIWEKLGVKNDVELVRYAISHGLNRGP
ncbi:MAG: response regulator transcription factor [Verrucomicrobiales bacterium]|nr:response regulator transcription factor [Verrucomicrobiales bacterium]